MPSGVFCLFPVALPILSPMTTSFRLLIMPTTTSAEHFFRLVTRPYNGSGSSGAGLAPMTEAALIWTLRYCARRPARLAVFLCNVFHGRIYCNALLRNRTPTHTGNSAHTREAARPFDCKALPEEASIILDFLELINYT